MEAGALSDLDFDTALAMLAWQVELGADEALAETPINRYEAEAEASAPSAQSGSAQSGPALPMPG
ncbi:MAG: uracil-DNA glycosylase, partial [Allgaiera sp.]|nr:uracil-DNA glycosylase [Allgaiera sp.]